MTDATREIFDRFEIRKSRKQKAAFIDWLRPVVEKSGYAMILEKCSFGGRNIIIGNPDKAAVVFTAHYDTCAVMPFPNFITPKNMLIYLLYQLLLAAVILLLPGLLVWLAAPLLGSFSGLAYLVLVYVLLGLMMLGPANRRTANDNTSGVTTVIDLMNAMPEQLRDKAAFILFDLEEAGLIGSASYASRHKKEMANKLLINFDCVSDGEQLLFVVRKKARPFAKLLERVFTSDCRVCVQIATKGTVYPSDQANFPCGVGVAALKKSRRLGILYMDRIHTPKDTIYREENIAYLVEGSIRLMNEVG